jgi:hypothetical protein
MNTLIKYLQSGFLQSILALYLQKRVGRLKRKYDSARIGNTPFTVVVSLPLYNSIDATYRVHAPKDVRRLKFDGNLILL